MQQWICSDLLTSILPTSQDHWQAAPFSRMLDKILTYWAFFIQFSHFNFFLRRKLSPQRSDSLRHYYVIWSLREYYSLELLQRYFIRKGLYHRVLEFWGIIPKKNKTTCFHPDVLTLRWVTVRLSLFLNYSVCSVISSVVSTCTVVQVETDVRQPHMWNGSEYLLKHSRPVKGWSVAGRVTSLSSWN